MAGLAAVSMTLTAVMLGEEGRPQVRPSAIHSLGPLTAIDAATYSGPSDVIDPPIMAPDDALSTEVDTPQRLRSVVRYCREAEHSSEARLKQVALTSGDPLVAGNSIRALGRLGLARSDTGMADLLNDPRSRIRQEAVIALGRSGDRAAVEQLAPLIRNEDPTLRALAIQALGRLGGTRAQSLLESILSDSTSTTIDRAFARSAPSRPGPTLVSSNGAVSPTRTLDRLGHE